MADKCPECGSEKIAGGIVISQPDYVTRGAYFRPKELKPFTLFGINISFPNNFSACIDCGFIWAKVKADKLKSVISKKGTDRLRERLGIKTDE